MNFEEDCQSALLSKASGPKDFCVTAPLRPLHLVFFSPIFFNGSSNLVPPGF